MKKFVLITLTSFILFSCNNNNNTYTLSATTNHDENKRVFLIKVGKDNRPIAVDSTEVLDGKFSFLTLLLYQKCIMYILRMAEKIFL